MMYTKEDIVNEYKKLRDFLGKPPSSLEFYRETNIDQNILSKIFGSKAYSKLVIECGDIPKVFTQPKSELSEIFTQWGKLVRTIGEIPTVADWKFYKMKPSYDAIAGTHSIKWADLPYRFLEFYSGNAEWLDVISLIPERSGENMKEELKIVPKIP